MRKGYLMIGVGGHVAAIEQTTGTEVWRTKLKGSDIVTILLRDGRVFAGAGGELFCLDETTGKILWRNKLKGLGLGLVAFGIDQEAAAGHDIVTRRRAAASAAVT